MARLWIFAGPNGAGKSTLVGDYVRNRLPIVNPDDIARTLAAVPSGKDAIEAARIAIRMRDDHLRAGRSFGIETTLTGQGELGLMHRARTAGFRVGLVFVGIDAVELSVMRVHFRVRRGGHDVPMADLLRRYDRSLGHLAAAMAVADRVCVLDNSGSRRRLLLLRKHDRTKYLPNHLPPWADAAIPADMR